MTTGTKKTKRPATAGRVRKSPPAALAGEPPEPDLGAALERVLKLMAIPGKSGEEGRVVEFITRQLRKAGVPASAITTDDTHRRTPHGGEVGNLICTLPGTTRAPRRL